VGGGFSDQAKIGRVLFEKVAATDAPARVEGLLKAWMAHRADVTESFFTFANRHESAALVALVGEADA
jgi:ferredoxin-nitrite reductase